MRSELCAILACTALAGLSAADEIAFPYKAYVTSEEVYVRSGPGKSYYPTGKLMPGAEVEVYRHDPGGWYAIRPPEGSFSWVSARYLESMQDNLARVTGDEVAARVGSQFSDIRDVIQVRLHRGEVVEVLDKKQFAAGPDAGTWYKISPPSGEFRWIFGKYVDPNFPKDGLRKSSAENNPLLHPTPPVGQIAAESSTPSPGEEKEKKPAAATQPEKTPIEAKASSAAAETQSSLDPTTYASREFRDSEDARAALGPTRQSSPEEFQEELDKLEMDLAAMLAEEPSVWSFDEIRLRAQSLMVRAETAVERGRARTLLNRVAQSIDIKQRFDAVAKLKTETERENRRLAELSEVKATSGSAPLDSERFDGTGRLARVVSPKLGAPQYALVDDNGNVQCYVTPAPGVNMQYYVGRRIGVTGVRGYIAEQRAQHVVAKNITSLDGTSTLR